VKLIIQIPCFNEEQTLGQTVAELPRAVEGFDAVEFLVIDDGSTDRTVEVARAAGVHHVVQLFSNRGLARGFMAGLDACIERGADVIVNTDADNQYCADDIQKLVVPILEQEADMVIGARPIQQIEHFSPIKRALQRLGSYVVRVLSKTNVPDAPSGFRAMSRKAAMRINVFNDYTYTLETIIQAGQSNLRVASVPVRVNGPTRPSRLMKGMLPYIVGSMKTLLSAYLIYRPAALFSMLAAVFLLPAVVLAGRYAWLAFVAGRGGGHVQSVMLAGVLALCGVFMLAIGVIAHLQGINRRLLEDIQYHERRRNGS
jgi:glycosyltransferase involved in cell wall biosynthesis